MENTHVDVKGVKETEIVLILLVHYPRANLEANDSCSFFSTRKQDKERLYLQMWK